MRRWRWLVPFVLLVSACGGGGSGSGASGDNVVESGDGLATVSLAPGSLPDGVSTDDVQLEVLVDETGEPGAPVVAVQLLPDGLVLAEPATLTVALPEALEGGFMAIHMSGDSIEFLDGDIQQDDEGLFAFQTTIGHFSVVTLYTDNFFDVSVEADPEKVSVGQTQGAAAAIAAKTDPISLWLYFGSDAPGTARLLTFAAPRAFIFEGGAISRNSFTDQEPWKPMTQRVEITPTPSGGETLLALFECLEENVIGPWFDAQAVLDLTLLERGEPVPKDFVTFAQLLSPEPMLPSAGSVELLRLSPGESFKAMVYLWSTTDSVCGEAADSGSSTADEDPEPEESVAVDAGAEALVGSYRGTMVFTDFPGGPSTAGYEAPFMVTIEPGEGGGYPVTLTQEPSSQVTVGMMDPTGSAFYTWGGQEGSYHEFYGARVRPVGSGQLEVVGVTFGGGPELAQREEELLQALTFVEVIDGELVVAPGAALATGGPLDPEQALEIATEMIMPGVDPTGLGIDWFLAVHGVFDLADSATETSTGVSEHSVTIGDIRYVIRAVTEVRTGATLGFTVCGYDADSGEALQGVTGYFTIGNDPGGPLASHASGTFGSDGCFSGSVLVNEPPGTTQGLVSDGSAVEKWGDITILPEEEDPEQFLQLLVDGLRGDTDFLVSRLNDHTIAIYGEEQCRTTLAGLLDPQAELEIREIGPIAPWDYVVDGITTPIFDVLPVEVQRLADGETIIQELHWQLVDGSWTWFSDCGDPIPGS